MVRAFEDKDVIHVDGRVDPADDAEAINLELILADLDHVERRLGRAKDDERTALEAVAACLREGKPARAAGIPKSAEFAIKSMGLLTLKPVLYCFNVDEGDFTLDRDEALARAGEVLASLAYYDPATDMFTLVSAKIESKLSLLPPAQEQEYLGDLGMDLPSGEPLESLLSHNALPRAVLGLLGLSIAYTGPGVPQVNN